MKNFESMVKEFGENIKCQREELGLSQKKLSEMTGISRSEISKYENGKNKNVSLRTMYKLYVALQMEFIL